MTTIELKLKNGTIIRIVPIDLLQSMKDLKKGMKSKKFVLVTGHKETYYIHGSDILFLRMVTEASPAN